MSIPETLKLLRDSGLGSITGGGAEIFDAEVRDKICRGKETADEWLDVHRTWHRMGGRSTSTMLYGHIETLEQRVDHLRQLRELQDETGGFTAFICWTFQPANTVLKVERPVGVAEYLRMQALSRIFLDNFPNVQSSWVTQGPDIGQVALKYGANDFGSVMMEENVVSSAGTTFRLDATQIETLIRDAGYEPRRRNNWYELLN